MFVLLVCHHSGVCRGKRFLPGRVFFTYSLKTISASMRRKAIPGIVELNSLLYPADKALQALERHLSRILNGGNPDAKHQLPKTQQAFSNGSDQSQRISK